MVAQVGSEQTGTVTLIPRGLRTEVVLKVNPGSPENDPQPVHIHFGNCGDGLGDVDVTLNDLAAGESVTLVDLSVSKLRDGDHAINLHKSYPEIRVYSACGNIPKR